MFQQSTFGAGAGSHNPMKDIEVQNPPEDSISKVAFSPNANYFIASSWDNNVSLLFVITLYCSATSVHSLKMGENGC